MKGVSLQIAGGFKSEVSSGIGLTRRTTFWVFEQPFAVIVNTYVTFIGSAVVLIKVSFTGPDPVAVELEMPDTAALDQANTAPGVKLVGVYANVLPLQTPFGVKVELKAGIGFNRTITVSVFEQPFAVIV